MDLSPCIEKREIETVRFVASAPLQMMIVYLLLDMYNMYIQLYIGGADMEQAAIRAWGNSQGIRISKKVMDALDLKVSDILDVTVEKNSIVLKKSFKHRSFEERLADYDGEISVLDFDWGEPAGREML